MLALIGVVSAAACGFFVVRAWSDERSLVQLAEKIAVDWELVEKIPTDWQLVEKIPAAWRTEYDGLVRLVTDEPQIQAVAVPAPATSSPIQVESSAVESSEETSPVGDVPLSSTLDDAPASDSAEYAAEAPVAHEAASPDALASAPDSSAPLSGRKETSRRSNRAVQQVPPLATGTLRLNSRPWSEVFVDGKRVGHTPQTNIELEAGEHRISLRNPEQRITRSFKIKIEPGTIETRIIDL